MPIVGMVAPTFVLVQACLAAFVYASGTDLDRRRRIGAALAVFALGPVGLLVLGGVFEALLVEVVALLGFRLGVTPDSCDARPG